MLRLPCAAAPARVGVMGGCRGIRRALALKAALHCSLSALRTVGRCTEVMGVTLELEAASG